MIFYFSGTGNSRWIAESLGKVLKEPVHAIVNAGTEANVYMTSEKENLGIVFPVHAWAPPAVVLDFISSLRLSCDPEYVYFVCTCGDDTGKTADIFQRAISQKGWRCNAGFSVIMPNTYVALPGFDVDLAYIASEKRRRAEKRIEYIACKLLAKEQILDCNEGAYPRMKTYLLRSFFTRFLMSPHFFNVASDLCISCGKCENVCPLNNIRLTEGKPRWGSHCSMCLACYHYCPKHAIEYGRMTRKKGQYYWIP